MKNMIKKWKEFEACATKHNKPLMDEYEEKAYSYTSLADVSNAQCELAIMESRMIKVNFSTFIEWLEENDS